MSDLGRPKVLYFIRLLASRNTNETMFDPGTFLGKL